MVVISRKHRRHSRGHNRSNRGRGVDREGFRYSNPVVAAVALQHASAVEAPTEGDQAFRRVFGAASPNGTLPGECAAQHAAVGTTTERERPTGLFALPVKAGRG